MRRDVTSLEGEKGSVLVEFAMLTPIYVLVIYALFYHFGLTNAMLDGARATIFAAGTSGVQSEADIPNRYFREGGVVIPGSRSTWTLEEEVAPELYTEWMIFSNLEEMARSPIGYYVYRNGEFHYILDEDRLSPWGRYIFSNNLQDLSEITAKALSESIQQTTAKSELNFEIPFYDANWVDLTDPGIVQATAKIEKQHTAYLPIEKDRGTHEAEGRTDFNRRVVSELFEETIPAHEDLNESYWVPN